MGDLRKLWEWLGFGKSGEKTGLDLLQFLVTVSIPILVAGGGIWFTEQRAQDEALQRYLDAMETLLLERNLRTSQEGDEARIVAQARTSTVLSRLTNAGHKGIVVRFLHDSNLIQKHQSIVRLTDVDLSGVDLKGANLAGAALMLSDLTEADLRSADLSGAFLGFTRFTYANLREADLREANLSAASFGGADLTGADLTGGANLTNARGLTQEQLEQAIGDESTELPEDQDLERPES
jgi:Pentapeptide repeats (8 copies)